MRTPRLTEAILAVAAAFAVLVGTGILAAVLGALLGLGEQPYQLLPYVAVVQAGFILVLVRYFAVQADESPRECLALGRGRRMWLAPLVLASAVVGDALMTALLDWQPILAEGNLAMLEQSVEQGGLPAAMVLLGVVVLAPLYEELLFRGYVYRGMQRSHGRLFAWVGTSALFALFHGDLLQALGAGVIGMFLGWLRGVTGSVWPCVVAHMLNNLLWTSSVLAPELIPDFPAWALPIAVSLLGAAALTLRPTRETLD